MEFAFPGDYPGQIPLIPLLWASVKL